ncbi:MAG: purine-nucleoside phosphorylase [Bacteroidia bacterium]|nr:purine-nucleoside phosphorylase [Bacteroidia bacterium]
MEALHAHPPQAMTDAVIAFTGRRIDAVVVLGSGLGGFAETVHNVRRIPAAELPGFPVSGVAGHAGELATGSVAGRTVLAFVGRLHGYEGHDVSAAAFPARIAARLGARCFIATNAAGGLHTAYQAGDLMLITDVLVLPLARRMGLDLHGPGSEDHPLPRPLFSEHLMQLARDAANEGRVRLREGTYGFCSGPTYETRAEIGMFRLMGADAVGMSTVPEILAAVRNGIPTLGISCITNKAVTVQQRVTHEDVTTVAAQSAEQFSRLLTALLGRL